MEAGTVVKQRAPPSTTWSPQLNRGYSQAWVWMPIFCSFLPLWPWTSQCISFSFHFTKVTEVLSEFSPELWHLVGTQYMGPLLLCTLCSDPHGCPTPSTQEISVNSWRHACTTRAVNRNLECARTAPVDWVCEHAWQCHVAGGRFWTRWIGWSLLKAKALVLIAGKTAYA